MNKEHDKTRGSNKTLDGGTGVNADDDEQSSAASHAAAYRVEGQPKY